MKTRTSPFLRLLVYLQQFARKHRTLTTTAWLDCEGHPLWRQRR